MEEGGGPEPIVTPPMLKASAVALESPFSSILDSGHRLRRTIVRGRHEPQTKKEKPGKTR